MSAKFRAVIGVAAIGIAAAALLSCRPASQPRPPADRIKPLTNYWEKLIGPLAPPDGFDTIRSRECAECHPDAYEEWRTSAHAYSFSDPQFQAEWRKDKHLWLCPNCHAPLANQQYRLITGLVDSDFRQPVGDINPSYDSELLDEGINCATCHIRDRKVIAKQKVAAPHSIQVDDHLMSHEWCIYCHNAKVVYGPVRICYFETGDEYRKTELPAKGVHCLDCHMPETTRYTSSGESRRGRLHNFLGAGIPKFAMEASGRSGLGVEVKADPGGYRPGQKAKITVVVTNRFAGHTIPTGDIERFALVHFRLLDGGGKVLWKDERRYGEEWEWWPKARMVQDTSIRRGESRTYDFEVPLPPGLEEASFEVTVEQHRMIEKNRDANKMHHSYPMKVEAWTYSVPLPLKGAAARRGGKDDTSRRRATRGAGPSMDG
ncbi:MAG: hypothetical protein HYZ28_12570 [Myxococcales bacterium]|nr:hypothetical protein [Myxococcales bacterium]